MGCLHQRHIWILFASVASLHFGATGLIFQPHPTLPALDQIRGQGVSHNPTSPPAFAQRLLGPRQAGKLNPTCGWVEGNGDDPVTCQSGFICGTTKVSIVGCCQTAYTSNLCNDIYTACYDVQGLLCDSSCQANRNNLICVSPTPYCAEYLYPGGSVGYGCGASLGFSKSVSLSINANNHGGSLTGVATAGSSSPTSTSSSPSSNSLVSSVPTSSTVSGSSHKSLTTGEIVGIAVAAAAVVITIAALGVYFLWRKRLSKSRTAPENRSSTYTQQSVQEPAPYIIAAPRVTDLQETKVTKSLSSLGRQGEQHPYTGPTIAEMDGGLTPPNI